MSGPPDKPGIVEVLQALKDAFGDKAQEVFEKTARINFNYEYQEANSSSTTTS